MEGRIVGTTLGISIPIEGLVGEDMRLDKDAADKIEDLALSIRRVILSTDRHIDFYILCARDTKMAGAEYVMTGYAMDIKRVLLRDLSRSQYISRLQRDFRLNPAILGENKIKGLFEDLSKNTDPESALGEYAHFSLSPEKVSEILYPAMLIAEPSSVRYEISELQYKEVSPDEALFWIKVKESYTPKPEAQNAASIFPPGFINEYIILVSRADRSKPIVDIVPKYFQSYNNIQQRFMDQIYDKYEDVAVVDASGLPLKEIKLTDVLSQQIARRLKAMLESEDPFKGSYEVTSVKGGFEDGIFVLNFDVQGDEKEIFAEALAAVRDVTREYWFEDFRGAKVTSDLSEKRVILDRENLRATGKKNIDIEKYLSFD